MTRTRVSILHGSRQPAISGAGTGLINLFGHRRLYPKLHLTRAPGGWATGVGGYLDHEMVTRDSSRASLSFEQVVLFGLVLAQILFIAIVF